MAICWLDDINQEDLAGKSVLCRVDFNVPISDDGHILDAQRIELSLPTLRKLIRAQAKLVVISHLGRPKGKPRSSLSLEPVANYLRDLLDQEVTFVYDCVGDGVARIIASAVPGSVTMLENLRFHGGEEKNDAVFAKLLAKNIDFYVNDAFGCVHRAHASVDGVSKFFARPMGGLLLKREIEAFTSMMRNPARPFVAIIGGAKVSSKIGVLMQLLKKVDAILIGGAMAYTFLKAQGFNVGASLVEDDKLGQAYNLLRKADELGVTVCLPVDHVVAVDINKKSEIDTILSGDFKANQIGLDIGPATVDKFSQVIAESKTIFWNGPLGMCEIDEFAHGTYQIIKAVAEANGLSMIGGGDSIAALNHCGLAHKIGFVSTGGGAGLEFLEGKALPGLQALGFYTGVV